MNKRSERRLRMLETGIAGTLKPEYAAALHAIENDGKSVKLHATSSDAAVRVFRAREALESRMLMMPAVRKLALAAHVTSSVGWLGAVAGFLALAIVGVRSEDSLTVRAAYLAMHLTTWYVIVPLSVAALVSGIVQSMGTTWGLFRHYWVVIKLLLTTIATLLLFVHTQPVDLVAAMAASSILAAGDLRQIRMQLIGDASAALFVLFAITALSVYKPGGLTAYGRRLESVTLGETFGMSVSRGRLVRATPSGRYVLLGIVGFVLLIVLLHLATGGLPRH